MLEEGGAGICVRMDDVVIIFQAGICVGASTPGGGIHNV